MIEGIGIDNIEIERVKKAIEREAFLKRIFTEKERLYLAEKGFAAQSAAGMFCAKEAVLKTMRMGITDGPLTDIEVLHEEGGAPVVKLHGKRADRSRGCKVFLSITHTRDYASALAVLERED
ncbi:MAG: holo-ACP synthase [Christensenella sp.]|uniref:holo-ACP synthase n=1 Tax=Christensenella sp. TaxID=1935934 RepID=UPI002B1F71CC|nr:holo-ACP synthase [Christensenella sp.]MEA5002776.1 holo-ACP synthase [Christensenella sp.]